MSKTNVGLVALIVLVAVLVAAGPTLVGLAKAATPLVLAIGGVVGVLRIVWFVTDRYR